MSIVYVATMSLPNARAPKGGAPTRAVRRDVNLLIGAQSVSTFGSFITRAALPLLAIIGLRISPAEAALLAAVDLVASALISQVAGIWIDRLPRRPFLIAADLARAVLLASIPLAAAFTAGVTLVHLIAVSALSGMATTAFDIAERSYLAGLVPGDGLRPVLARVLAIRGAAEFFGFGAAGILIERIGGPAAIGIDAITYLVSALFITLLRVQEPRLPAPSTRRTARAEFREGLTQTWSVAIMRPLLASSFVVGIYFGLFRSSYMLFLVRGLDLSAGTIGWIIATGGIAALVGGALTERLSLAVGTGRAVVLGLFFVGFGLTLVPLALLIPGAVLLLLVLHQLLSDGFETVWDANQGAIRGRVLPANYQGRANAAFEGVNIAGRLSGILVGGAIGSSVFGSGASLLLGGGASMLVGLIVARSRIGRLRSLKELPVARQAKARREA